jgi:glycosyl transferase, family 25
MKAYFTNLDEAQDRRAYMEGRLTVFGIPFERVQAIDARIMPQEEIDRNYVVPEGEKPIDRGSVGSFLTHRSIWRKIAASDDPYTLVFEDDVLFGKDAQAILTDTSWIPEGTPLIRFETFGRHTVYETAPVTRVAGRDLVNLRYQHLGSAAYLLSKEAAAELVRQTETFGYAPDYVLFNPDCPEFCGFEVLQMVPALCIQSAIAPEHAKTHNFPSIIQKSRKANFSKGLKRFGEKVAREVRKNRLIASGFLFDRTRGRKTGRIPFR